MQNLNLDTEHLLVWQRFNNAYVNNRLPKALLLINPFGVVENQLINMMQVMLVCSQQKAPCGQCRNCKLALQGVHPDIDIISKPDGKSFISIEAVRDVQEHLYLTPQCSKRRIVYFSDLDSLTAAAFESLLKILEEPPEAVFFIAKALSLQKILPTVLSRFQRAVFVSPKVMPENYIDYAVPLNLLHDLDIIVDDLQAVMENKLCIYILAEKWSVYHFRSLVDLLYCLLAQMIKLKFKSGVDNENENVVISKIYCLCNKFSLWLLLESFASLINLSKQLKMAVSLNVVLSLEIWLQNLCSVHQESLKL